MARAPLRVQPVAKCEPTDDRCARGVEPTFMPGISVKHSPSCHGDICNLFACDGGNWRVTGSGTLDRSEWIKGWAVTQLLTRGFIDCDEHPLQQRSGGWWMDTYRSPDYRVGGAGFRSGSKLWALAWFHGGATNGLLVRAMDYAYEALQYLQRWGIGRVDVNAVWATRGARFPGAVMHLMINIVGPGVVATFSLEGQRQPSNLWLWQELRPPSPNRTIGRLHGTVALPTR